MLAVPRYDEFCLNRNGVNRSSVECTAPVSISSFTHDSDEEDGCICQLYGFWDATPCHALDETWTFAGQEFSTEADFDASMGEMCEAEGQFYRAAAAAILPHPFSFPRFLRPHKCPPASTHAHPLTLQPTAHPLTQARPATRAKTSSSP